MKRFARFCTVLMVLVMAFSLTMTAYAAGSVAYDADANKFVFAPGTDDAPTSLFADFQNVMPGDKLTEQIVIKNDTAKKVNIRVYLRSLGAQEDTDEFLSQMTLTVTQKTDTILFDAPADQTAQLTGWVCLGTFYSGAKVDLDVTLNVPIEKGDPESPKTGGTSNIMLCTGLMAVSLVAVAILVLLAKKRKAE